VTILVTNNSLFYKLLYKLITIVTYNSLSLKLIVNGRFYYNDIVK